MRKGWVLVAAVLLSGCASEDPSAMAAAADDLAAAGTPFLPAPTPLRFASGDYEGTMTGEATFSIAQQCILLGNSCAGGEEVFDLTEIVPAEAPVELIVDVHGARASLEFVDASFLGEPEGEWDGQATRFANIVVRGEGGKVLLHVYNPGGFEFPPNPAPTASFDAASVVRADRLVADVPAALRMTPGQSINLTSEDVEEALFIDPAGAIERRTEGPFTFTANGTAGDYTILMIGQGSTAITGPATELVARRIAMVQGDPQPLTSGSETTWSFTTDTRPLLVGVEVRSGPTAGTPFPVGSMMTQLEARLTGPGNVVFIDESMQCMPSCGFFLGGFSWGYGTEYLDERLQAGQYDVSVTYTGNGMQGAAWYMALV